ncbi:MAG TPA: lipopolysaccharide biosynthesis protein [Terriglobia bacterium]|nr:lipopolysaccharide biosynthesis protein [Terriglobia bacterium]
MMPAQQLEEPLSTEHLKTDLKGRSVRGGVVTVASQGSQFVVQSVLTVVLARLLTPADFGLVAMVTAVTGLAQAFADVGLSEATIQCEEISHNQVSILFWINLAVGMGLALITVGLGPALAWLDREPRLTDIAFVLSLTFLFGGLRVQPDAILKRQMRFTALAMRDIAASALGVAAAVVMAWRGAGYWALVAFPLTSTFTQMALSWWMVNWRPSLPRRAAQVGSLVAFGGNVAVSYFIYNLNRSVDKILVGWYWSAGPLGLYSRASNLVVLPLRQLAAPVAGVVVPTFSRLQNDPERFARYYLRTVNLVVWVMAPLFAFLFVAARPVIALVLGPQWGESAPVFQILVISGLAQLLFDSTLWLFVSRGQSAKLRNVLLVAFPAIGASYVIGLPFGIKGVALAYTLALLAMMPWALKFTFRGTELTLQRLGQALVYPVSLSLVSALFGEIALHVFAPQGVFPQFLAIGLGFGFAFSLSAAIPAVRAEVVALKLLLGELRFARQAA